MALEIERKFLVVSDAWRKSVSRRIELTDGLLARFAGGKIRVRLKDEDATLTIKGRRNGIARAEYEYPIPRGHALEILATCSDGPVLRKTRHLVPDGAVTWEIDVYQGPLAGLVLAEVELTREDQAVRAPAWLGREVTHDPAYSSASLAARSHPD